MQCRKWWNIIICRLWGTLFAWLCSYNGWNGSNDSLFRFYKYQNNWDYIETPSNKNTHYFWNYFCGFLNILSFFVLKLIINRLIVFHNSLYPNVLHEIVKRTKELFAVVVLETLRFSLASHFVWASHFFFSIYFSGTCYTSFTASFTVFQIYFLSERNFHVYMYFSSYIKASYGVKKSRYSGVSMSF